MARNIVGSKFDDYVKKQIEYRQEKLFNLDYSKSDNLLLYQNANTAFLRLTSGVDINDDEAKSAEAFQLFNTKFAGELAAGVGLGGNTAYGFLSTSGYGYSPPPGLVSADVKSLNRGSLREATIKIVCHNIEQFNIIDKLYLRLGYSMLLEWGWSQYYDNKGVFHTSYHNVATRNFFLKKNDQINILNQIQADRVSSCGNYDAMFGLVKNYSWSLEKDGSYDITLNLVSVGDVIESLKANTSHPNTAPTKTENIPQDQPPLQYNAQKSTLNKILWWLTEQLKPEDLYTGSKFYLQGSEVTANLIASGIGLTPNQTNDDNGAAGEVIGFIFPQLLGVKGTQPGVQAQYFMKLGFLLRCLQNFCLLYDTSNSTNQGLINLDFDKNSNFCFTYPRHGSLDPRVCLIDVIKDLEGTVPPAPANSTSPTNPSTSTGVVMNTKEYVFYAIYISDNATTQAPISFDWALMTSEVQPTTYFGGSGDNSLLNGYNTILNGSLTPYANVVDKDQVDADLAKYSKSDPGYEIRTSTSPATSTIVTVVPKTSFENNSSFYQNFVNNVLTPLAEPGSGQVDIGLNNEVLTKIENGPIIFEKTFTYDSFGGFGSQTQGKIYIKEFKYTTVSFTDSNAGYVPTNVTTADEENNLDVSNNLFDNIRNGSQFRYDPTAKKNQFIGRTLNIYVNMDYIAKTLENYIDVKTGAISVYDFLDKLMNGIQHALGNINNFNVSYDQDANTFRIIDSTFIPGLGNIPEASGSFEEPTKFITHTLDSSGGSFVRDASVKTQLSNNFATQVTVGAQANGNVVGSNSTALSKWNVGLKDRIIHTKQNVNDPKPGAADVATNYYSNVGLVQNLYSAVNDGNITDEQIDGSRDAGVDLFNFELGEYVKEDIIPSIGFLPINLELTMDGLSGIRIYESYTADTRLLPERYQDKIQFITTGISHKIQNNDWTTTISSISGPKYNGKEVKEAPAIKTHNLGWLEKIVQDAVGGNVGGRSFISWENQKYKDVANSAPTGEVIKQGSNNYCSRLKNGKLVHTGTEPQFSEKRTPRSIILHVTDGAPKSSPQEVVDFVGRCNGKFARGGIHYAVGRDGKIVAGIPENVVSVHGDNWNEYGIGIEIVHPYTVFEQNGKYYWADGYEVPASEVVILNWYYGGENKFMEYSDEQLNSLKKLIREIWGRYPDIRTAYAKYTPQKIYKSLWGFNEIPKSGQNYTKQPANRYNQYGIFGHATGGGDHGDPAPTPKLIKALTELIAEARLAGIGNGFLTNIFP